MKKYLVLLLSCIIIAATVSAAFADAGYSKLAARIKRIQASVPASVAGEVSAAGTRTLTDMTLYVPDTYTYDDDDGTVLLYDIYDRTAFMSFWVGTTDGSSLSHIADDYCDAAYGYNFRRDATSGWYAFDTDDLGTTATVYIDDSTTNSRVPSGYYWVQIFSISVPSGTRSKVYSSVVITVSPINEDDDYTIHTDSDGLHTGTVGVYYSELLTCDFSDARWELDEDDSNLPEGLSINPNTGEIYGTPRKSGTFTFRVNVSWPEPGYSYIRRTDFRYFTITINPSSSGGSSGGSSSGGTTRAFSNMSITVPSDWTATEDGGVVSIQNSSNMIMLATGSKNGQTLDSFAQDVYNGLSGTKFALEKTSDGYYAFVLKNNYDVYFQVYVDDDTSFNKIPSGNYCIQMMTKNEATLSAFNSTVWPSISFNSTNGGNSGTGGNSSNGGNNTNNLSQVIQKTNQNSSSYTDNSSTTEGDINVIKNGPNVSMGGDSYTLSGGGCNAGFGLLGLLMLGAVVRRRKS